MFWSQIDIQRSYSRDKYKEILEIDLEKEMKALVSKYIAGFSEQLDVLYGTYIAGFSEQLESDVKPIHIVRTGEVYLCWVSCHELFVFCYDKN